MTRRLMAALGRTLTRNWTPMTGHFHAGPAGPYVCHDPSCTTPSGRTGLT